MRSQIKQPPNEGEERVLFVNDDVTGKKIEIEFDDKNEALVPEYSKVDKNTNSIYKIKDLKIKRELITGNDKSVNKAFDDYEYTIDINAKLDDDYFSKKTTQIDDVKILASNRPSSETGGDGGDGDIIEVRNETIAHGDHQLIIVSEPHEETFINNLENNSYKYRFVEYKNTHHTYEDNGHQIPWDPSAPNPTPPDGAWECEPKELRNDNIYKVQGVTTIVEYKQTINNVLIKLTVDNKESFIVNDSYTLRHKAFDEIGIEVENAGVILKNLHINGKLVGDVATDTVYKLKDKVDEVTLKFEGFDVSGNKPKGSDKSKVYIEFADSKEE